MSRCTKCGCECYVTEKGQCSVCGAKVVLTDDRHRAALELAGGNPWHLTHADTCALQVDGDDCTCGLDHLRAGYDRAHQEDRP